MGESSNGQFVKLMLLHLPRYPCEANRVLRRVPIARFSFASGSTRPRRTSRAQTCDLPPGGTVWRHTVRTQNLCGEEATPASGLLFCPTSQSPNFCLYPRRLVIPIGHQSPTCVVTLRGCLHAKRDMTIRVRYSAPRFTLALSRARVSSDTAFATKLHQ